jgi:hypothetical protein
MIRMTANVYNMVFLSVGPPAGVGAPAGDG